MGTRVFHFLDWMIFLIEVIALFITLYCAYMLAVTGQPAYTYLVPIASLFAWLGGMLWNKVYQRAKAEMPGYTSPGTLMIRLIDKGATRVGVAIGPIKTGLCWIMGNMFVYWYLLLSLKTVSERYYYYASGMFFHLIIAQFILYMIVRTRETPYSLGCRLGNWKVGVSLVPAFFVPLGAILLRSHMLGVSVKLAYFETALTAILTVGFYGLWVPVTEEIMFRGYIQREFQRTMKRASALFWASFLFVTVHLPKIFVATEYLNSEIGLPLLATIPAVMYSAGTSMPFYDMLFHLLRYGGLFFLASVAFGVLYRETDSVLYPIICHGIYNLSCILIAFA